MKNPPPLYSDRQPLRHRGFTLVITLSLMILLTVLAVGLLTLSSVSLHASSQGAAMATARANARLALMFALNDLQKNAGPDQRVTARAEILDSKPATPAIDGVNQPYWTASWKTGPAGLDITTTGITPQRQTSLGATAPTITQKVTAGNWLVSNSDPGGPTQLDPTTYNGTAPNAVVVAKQLGKPPLTPSDVTVPLVKIVNSAAGLLAGKTTGRYGYWVSDEGVKARVNLVDPTIALGGTTGQAHFLAPQANAIHKIDGMTSGADLRSTSTTSDLAKTLTANTIGLLGSASPGLKINTYLPDVTADSCGVIVDVKNGGLKKDLTAAFENTPGTATSENFSKLVNYYGYGKKTLYRNMNGLTVPPSGLIPASYQGITDGLPWGVLYAYYNIYKTTMTRPSVFTAAGTCGSYPYPGNNIPYPPLFSAPATNTPTTWPTTNASLPSISSPPPSLLTGSFSHDLPLRVLPRVVTLSVPAGVGAAVGKYGGLVPEVIAHRTDISLDSELVGAIYKLRLRYSPQLVLYNPYNCRLLVTPTSPGPPPVNSFQMTRGYQAFGGDAITVEVDGKVVATDVVLNQAGRHLLQSAPGQCDWLEPGETRVFGQVANARTILTTNTHPVTWPPLEKYTSSSTANAITFSGNFPGTNPPIPKSLTSSHLVSPDKAQWCYLPISTTLVTHPPLPVVPPSLVDTLIYENGPDWDGKDAVSRLPVAGTAVVKVSWAASYNSQFSGGAGDTYVLPESKWPYGFDGQRIFNISGPSVRRTGSWPSNITLSSLESNPRILTGFCIRKKGISSSSSTYTNGPAVIPLFHGNAPYFTPFDNLQSCAWAELFLNEFGKSFTSSSEVNVSASMDSQGREHLETSFGELSVGVGGSPTRHVLRDVPNQPLVSLGQFMHMPTLVFANANSGVTDYFKFGMRDTGSMFIGGSLANPFIPTQQNLADGDATRTNVIYDDSFLANDTLFDRFFFSTVPPASPNSNKPQQWTKFNSDVSGASASTTELPPALPNSRIKPYKNGTALTLGDLSVATVVNDLRDFDKAAANLMLEGAFNVNSTSVNAWKALLSSLSGNDMGVFMSASRAVGSITSASLKNPIPRFWSSSSTGDVNGPWDGNRALTDTQINDLATCIVEQVKKRGPFLSLSDFLNRRLGDVNTLGPLARAGCLQSAIDNTSINDSVKGMGIGATVSATGTGMALSDTPNQIRPVIDDNLRDGSDYGGVPLHSTVGMPGYLMQQDIVQAFSPAMTVRSDTFVVRAYGESLNPASGAVEAKAWAEAVVQRVPEYVDQSDSALTAANVYGSNLGNATPPYNGTNLTSAPVPIVNTLNLSLGRRFKVVGFRWLSLNEL